MAKNKTEDLNDDVTFNGQKIDPEIQKKVDQYMDLNEPDVPEVGSAEVSPEKVDPVSESDVTDTSTAPLLPTDQLPDSVKDTPAPVKKNIAVTHIDEPEQPTAPVLPEDLGEEEEVSVADTVADAEEADESSSDTAEEPAEVVEDDSTPEEDLQQTPEPELEKTELDTEDTADIEAIDDAEPESIVSIDAENLAAPDFSEAPDYDGKTIADMEKADLPLDDPETAKAIDEIIASDSDKLLEIEDGKTADVPVSAVPVKKAKKSKDGNFLKKWFKTPLYRNATILAVLVAIGVVLAVPTTRYFVLNSAGVRVSTSIRVLDDSTSLPLKNVELSVAGKSAKTDGDGNVKLDEIPLGQQTMIIKKPAFAEISRDVTLGWGSNPLGDFRLVPTGSQYVFKVTDFLSGKPIANGELIYEEANAKFSDKGEAVITIPNVKEEEINIDVIAENYRSESVKVNTSVEQEYSVAMVPAKQHVFFSKRSGKVDLYKADVDGKNEEVLLSGTGIERDDSLGIAPHQTKNITAFSSSRENVRNRDGFLLNTLQLIDLETKEVTKVAQSERIQIINWAGDRLVYVKIAQGASQADPKRHRLMSYDISSKTEAELASTNYFNDVLAVNDAIYYSPALYKVNGSVGLYKINADGSNKKTVFQKEVWNLFRTSYDKVSLSVGQDWYELNLANDAMVKIGGAPSVLKSRVYVKSLDGKQSAWIDERDGKTVLIIHNNETNEDRVLLTQSGIKNPVRWLDNDHIVYRIANGQETADFVISIGGGEPKKIVDVMNSYGIDRWYYF